MAALSIVVLLPLLLTLGLAVAIAVGLALTARPDQTLASEVAAARRHAVITSGLALLTLLVTPLLAVPVLRLASTGTAGALLTACLPLAASAASLLVLAAGEATWPRPTGVTRTALLQPRSVRDLARGPWAWAAAGATAALVVALVACGLGAYGSPGWTVARTHDGGVETRGPFPGWAFGVPQLCTLAVVVALAGLVLRTTTRRASVVSADLETDRLLRRASAARAFKALLVGVLSTLGADLAVAGQALAGLHREALPHVAWTAVTLLGAGCLLAALVTLLVPAPRLPRPAPAAPQHPVPA